MKGSTRMASYGKGTTVVEKKEPTIGSSIATLIFGIPMLTGLLGFLIWFNLFIWGQVF